MSWRTYAIQTVPKGKRLRKGIASYIRWKRKEWAEYQKIYKPEMTQKEINYRIRNDVY